MSKDNEGRIYRGNKLIGHVTDGDLYGIDADGYAVMIGPINHDAEIQTRLNAWRKQQRLDR